LETWEYKQMVFYHTGLEDKKNERLMNAMGMSGWELVAINNISIEKNLYMHTYKKLRVVGK